MMRKVVHEVIDWKYYNINAKQHLLNILKEKYENPRIQRVISYSPNDQRQCVVCLEIEYEETETQYSDQDLIQRLIESDI